MSDSLSADVDDHAVPTSPELSRVLRLVVLRPTTTSSPPDVVRSFLLCWSSDSALPPPLLGTMTSRRVSPRVQSRLSGGNAANFWAIYRRQRNICTLAVQYSAVRRLTVPYGAALLHRLCCNMHCGTVRYGIRHRTASYRTVPHSTARCRTVLLLHTGYVTKCIAMHCGAAQHRTAPYRTVRRRAALYAAHTHFHTVYGAAFEIYKRNLYRHTEYDGHP